MQHFTSVCGFLSARKCRGLFAGVRGNLRRLGFLLSTFPAGSGASDSVGRGFRDFSCRSLTTLKCEGYFPPVASHPQRRIQFHPDSEEWGGGGEPARAAGHPGWCPGEKGPQILHCSGVLNCFGSWQNAIGDQPQADHILRTWLPPRSPWTALWGEERHSFCRPWKGLTGLLNPPCFPLETN